jgi:integrase
MALMSHLLKDRHGTYYTRRIIPPALRPFMPEPWKGKSEWKRTLGTKDPKEAKRANIAMLAQMQAAFTVAEARKKATTRDSLTDEEISAIADWYALEALSQDTAFREVEHADAEAIYGEVHTQLVGEGAPFAPLARTSGWGMSDWQLHKRREGLEDVLAGLKAGLGRGDTRLVEDEVDDLEVIFGLTVNRQSSSRRRLALAVLRKAVGVATEKLARLNGEGSEAPEPWTPPQDGTVLPVSAPLAGASDAERGPLLTKALEIWREGGGARGAKKPSPRVVMDAEYGVRRFTELHGDVALGDITKKMVREYRVALSRMATRLSADLKALPLPELLKRDLSAFPPVNAATVNKTLTLVGAIVAHAERDGYLEAVGGFVNPFRNMRVVLEKDDEDNRLPFEPDDLKAIFSAPVHASGDRPRGGAGEAAFWFPVLGLMMGGRLQEIADLRLCDVRKAEDGIWHFDINDEDGRRLKTRSSRRKVPLHPVLVDIGFLDYLAALREATEDPKASLWPEIGAVVGSSAPSAPWSKWFGRYLRGTVGIGESRKVFHSFRHTFKRLTRDAGIPEEMHDALTGHGDDKGSVGRRYGRGVSLPVLAARMREIQAPEAVKGLRWRGRRENAAVGSTEAD